MTDEVTLTDEVVDVEPEPAAKQYKVLRPIKYVTTGTIYTRGEIVEFDDDTAEILLHNGLIDAV